MNNLQENNCVIIVAICVPFNFFLISYCLVLMLCILKKLSPLWHYAPFSLENTFVFPKGEFKSTIRAICNESLIIQNMFWTQFCLGEATQIFGDSHDLLSLLYFFTRKVETKKITLYVGSRFLQMFTLEPKFNMSCLVLAIELIWNRDTLNRSFF